MYTLHWEYMAGSIVAQAMLEEAGASYRLAYVDMGANEHKKAAYLRINPAARVPALTMPDGSTIGETSAIVIALGEAFPRTGLTPLANEKDRGAFLFWLSVMATAGYLTVSRKAHPERYAFDPAAIAQVETQAARDLDAFFDVMEGAIAGEDAFLPSGFSALDLYLAMLTEWSEDRTALFADRPALARLCEAASGREAYLAAMETHRPSSLVATG
jgi:glutathione S-transferase